MFSQLENFKLRFKINVCSFITHVAKPFVIRKWLGIFYMYAVYQVSHASHATLLTVQLVPQTPQGHCIFVIFFFTLALSMCFCHVFSLWSSLRNNTIGWFRLSSIIVIFYCTGLNIATTCTSVSDCCSEAVCTWDKWSETRIFGFAIAVGSIIALFKDLPMSFSSCPLLNGILYALHKDSKWHLSSSGMFTFWHVLQVCPVDNQLRACRQ